MSSRVFIIHNQWSVVTQQLPPSFLFISDPETLLQSITEGHSLKNSSEKQALTVSCASMDIETRSSFGNKRCFHKRRIDNDISRSGKLRTGTKKKKKFCLCLKRVLPKICDTYLSIHTCFPTCLYIQQNLGIPVTKSPSVAMRNVHGIRFSYCATRNEFTSNMTCYDV